MKIRALLSPKQIGPIESMRPLVLKTKVAVAATVTATRRQKTTESEQILERVRSGELGTAEKLVKVLPDQLRNAPVFILALM